MGTSRYGWIVTGYYGPDAKPPKRRGELALSVWAGTEHVRDTEVSVFEGRDDIGTVLVREASAAESGWS